MTWNPQINYSKPSIYRASIYRVPLFTGPPPFPPIFLPRYFPIKFGNLLVRFEMKIELDDMCSTFCLLFAGLVSMLVISKKSYLHHVILSSHN